MNPGEKWFIFTKHRNHRIIPISQTVFNREDCVILFKRVLLKQKVVYILKQAIA